MNQAQRQSGSLISTADMEQIIRAGNSELLVMRAREVGSALKRGKLKTAQIRRVFTTARRMEASWGEDIGDVQQVKLICELRMLIPRLHYQADRFKEVRPLRDVLVPAIEMVGEEREYFLRFVDFFEAIVAFHAAS